MIKAEFNQIAAQIYARIEKSNSVLLTCHPSADADSVGSVLVFKEALGQMGKKVVAIRGDDDLLSYLLTLPGADAILKKNFSEINFEDFDLLIAVDISEWQMATKLIPFPEADKGKIIVIDHHATNLGWGGVNLVVKDASATTQIIYTLFKEWGVKINSSMAKNLLAGIYADTGGFKYSTVTGYTFEIVTDLVKTAPDFHQVIFDLENTMEPENLKYIGLALNLLETYFSSKVAVSSIPLVKMRALGIKPVHTYKMEIANMLKSVVGWEIGVCMTELEGGKTKVSLRTRDAEKWDMGCLAKALGGGGHKLAAGATINQPLKQAEVEILKTIQKVFPELGEP